MDRFVDLGRLRDISEKILSARQDRTQFIVNLKRTVADLRKGFVEENLAIHRAWFGPSVAEKAAETARVKTAEAARVKAVEESRAKAAKEAQVKAAAEAARVKAVEESRAKAAKEAQVKAAAEAAHVKAVEEARVKEMVDTPLVIKPLAIVAEMIRAEKMAEAEKSAQAMVTKPHKNKPQRR